MAAPQQIPRVLYKYYPPERIDILDNWTVRFTNPVNFNDAFDTNWPATERDAKMERLKFRNSIGIFSLSEKGNNHLMWVHYADQHRGFVIAFKSTAGFLTNSQGELRKVKYEEPPVWIPEVKERCWYKDPEWQYEQEWRYIRNIGSGKPRDIAFDPVDIAEIIIGSEMSDTNINAILNTAEAVNIDQVLWGVRIEKLDISSRAIRLDACQLSLCTHCGGRGHVKP